ncbi:MAG: carboxypeptidase-like regulatory domain-containing protein [Bacteroidetes bacterium]|nr:carboxypeptidase-like regulatory domain-containing protein [Bacteroidota bacterium]
MTKKISGLLAFLLIFSIGLIYFSCKKKDTDTNTNSTGVTLKSSIAGIIKDEQGNALEGVTVTAEGQTATTDYYGSFIFDNINLPKDRCSIKAVKQGFFNSIFSCIPAEKNVTYVKIKMLKKESQGSFNSSAGATISLTKGAVIQLPANGYITPAGLAYTGQVNVVAKQLNPDDSDFAEKIPGNDLMAVDSTNQSKKLFSYGMIGVELTDNANNLLQLAKGSEAMITFPMASFQTSNAPSTLPIWHFDEVTSLWKQEGMSTRSGNTYSYKVSHFSWHNLDGYGDEAILKVRVVDNNGDPLSNININVDGYINTTDNNGIAKGYVLTKTNLHVKVLASQNSLVFSDSKETIVPSLIKGQVYDMGNLVVNSNLSTITGTTIGCTQDAAAVVIVSWNGTEKEFQVINNGKRFSVKVPPNVNAKLNFISFGYSKKTILMNSGQSNAITNLGDILLCNSDNVIKDNSVYLQGDYLQGALYFIDTASCKRVYDTFAKGNKLIYSYSANRIDHKNPVTISLYFPLKSEVRYFGYGTYDPENVAITVNCVSVKYEYWRINDCNLDFSLKFADTTNITKNIKINKGIDVEFSGLLHSQTHHKLNLMGGRINTKK